MAAFLPPRGEETLGTPSAKSLLLRVRPVPGSFSDLNPRSSVRLAAKSAKTGCSWFFEPGVVCGNKIREEGPLGGGPHEGGEMPSQGS